jgi:DNA polymerase
MRNSELLQWYALMGVDEAIEDTPQNYLAQKQKPTMVQQPEQPMPAPSMPQAPVMKPATITSSPHVAVTQARDLADKADSLEKLREAVSNFDGCSLKKTATNTVFAEGNPEAKIMVIGEAPGANEDKEGIPFCGASGQLLDKALASIGLSRKTNLYITNNLFWRPPGNRRPTPEELAICSPFVEKHIALINPKLLILAGSTSATSILQKNTGITQLRGKLYEYTNQYLDHTIPVIVTYHPSYLLRQPSQKKLVWQDMLLAKQYIAQHIGDI